jgi:hypothetical protein
MNCPECERLKLHVKINRDAGLRITAAAYEGQLTEHQRKEHGNKSTIKDMLDWPKVGLFFFVRKN